MTKLAANKGNVAFEDREFPFTDKDFKTLRELVYDKSGIVLADHKRNLLYGRLARRIRALNLKSFAEYCALVAASGDDETPHLINAVTTNHTNFFREVHHFEYLKEKFLPEIKSAVKPGTRPRVRMWSAGCSSGEEPYTLMSTMISCVPDLAQWDYKLLATDLDTNVLDRARTGEYEARALEQFPQWIAKKQLVSKASRDADKFRFNDDVKKYIAYKQLNLLKGWPMKGPFDVIFCRNVMIYFDGPTKDNLIRRFIDLVRPGGLLIIGHSESIGNPKGLGLAVMGRTIYRKGV